MQVNLVFLKKDGTTQGFTLPSSVTFLGRRQDCDFCVPLMVISRRHCEINTDHNRIMVRDLRSRNGTFVNGNRIEEAQLNAGDILRLGPVEFVVQVDGLPDRFDEFIAGREERARQAAEEFADETPDVDATQEADFEDLVGDLAEADLGQSHTTELLGDLSEGFDLHDDFNLDENLDEDKV